MCWILLWGLAPPALSCRGAEPQDDGLPPSLSAEGAGHIGGSGHVDRGGCRAGGKRVESLDLNRDGRPEIWKLYEKKIVGCSRVEVLTCQVLDLNLDGRKDLWIYFDSQGSRAREELDLDADGRIDLVTTRRGDGLSTKALDTNFDGRADTWQHSRKDVIEQVWRDRDSDGRVDVWEHYQAGQLHRIGYDRDGDGKPETFERAPASNVATEDPRQAREPAKTPSDQAPPGP